MSRGLDFLAGALCGAAAALITYTAIREPEKIRAAANRVGDVMSDAKDSIAEHSARYAKKTRNTIADLLGQLSDRLDTLEGRLRTQGDQPASNE